MKMTTDLKSALCKYFCADVLIKETGVGLVVSVGGFGGDSHDRIGVRVVDVGGGYYLADDGDYLSSLDACGLDIANGGRRQFLDGILKSVGAFWDRETFVIRTEIREGSAKPADLISFLISLVRVRDVQFWTREVIRSTFKEDALSDIEKTFKNYANLNANSSIDSDLKEFPADVVVSPFGIEAKTAVYLVNSNDGMAEALGLWQETQRLAKTGINVMAIIESDETPGLNTKKVHRMANRIGHVAYYRGDERAAMERLRVVSGISQPLHSFG
jgi:hypothetical protein